MDFVGLDSLEAIARDERGSPVVEGVWDYVGNSWMELASPWWRTPAPEVVSRFIRVMGTFRVLL
jgi:hypothetical protein